MRETPQQGHPAKRVNTEGSKDMGKDKVDGDRVVKIEIPRTQAAALLLITQRLTFDDCLRWTNGSDAHPETGDAEQAYQFINAIGVLRDAIDNSLSEHEES